MSLKQNVNYIVVFEKDDDVIHILSQCKLIVEGICTVISDLPLLLFTQVYIFTFLLACSSLETEYCSYYYLFYKAPLYCVFLKIVQYQQTYESWLSHCIKLAYDENIEWCLYRVFQKCILYLKAYISDTFECSLNVFLHIVGNFLLFSAYLLLFRQIMNLPQRA